MINCRAWIGLLFALLGGVGQVAAETAPAHEVIDRAHFIHMPSVEAPSSGPEGRSWRSLPDRAPSIPAGTVARYEAGLNLKLVPSSTWAVYLPEISDHATIFLNDRWIGAAHRGNYHSLPPMTRPLYLKIPAGFLRAGANTLRIDLESTPSAFHISRIHVGPVSELQGLFERRTVWRIKVPYVVQMTTTVIGVLFIAVGLLRRQERHLLWLAAATASFWMSYDAGLIAEWIVSYPKVMEMGLLGFSVCLMLFVRRYCGLHQTSTERTLILVSVPALALIVLQPTVVVSEDTLCKLLLPGLVAIAVYCASVSWQHFVHSRTRLNALMAIAVSAVAALSLHEWFIDLGWLDIEGPHLNYLGIPVLQVAAGGTLVGTYISALRRAQTLNAKLAQLVRLRTHELGEHHERLRRLERAQVLAAERERMMKDLHDGIGSQLISALALMEGGKNSSNELAECLRGTLDDLRLVLESLDPSHGDLCTVLASLRPRMEACLESKGIVLLWRLTSLPSDIDLGPHRALQVLRIVQEAVTNVIKHAGARTVTIGGCVVSEDQDSAAVIIDIADDGVGIKQGSLPGKGMKTMAARAADIGACLDIASTDKGTKIRLSVPLRTQFPG